MEHQRVYDTLEGMIPRNKKPLVSCALFLTLALATGCSVASSQDVKDHGSTPESSHSAVAEASSEAHVTASKVTQESEVTANAGPAAPPSLANFSQPVIHKGQGTGEISLNGLAANDSVLLFVKNLKPGQLNVDAVSSAGTTPLVSITAGHYDGTIVALAGTTTLKVSAAGGWLVKVMPAKTVRKQSGGAVISGNGDDVIAYSGPLTHASIQGFGGSASVAALKPGSTLSNPGSDVVLSDSSTQDSSTKYLVVNATASWKIWLR